MDCSEILIGTECCCPDFVWNGSQGKYHSSFGPFTLAPNLFLGTIKSAGLDLQKFIWFETSILKELLNPSSTGLTITVIFESPALGIPAF